MPRYSGEHADNNLQLATAFDGLAKEIGCSPAQLAIAWVLAQGDNIIPIPGTKKREKLQDNAGSINLQLTAENKQEMEDLLKQYPNVGDRYDEGSKKMVDKEA